MGVNFAYAAGFAVGIIFVFAVFFIMWKWKGVNLSGKYDERQELIRGRGYKYGFFAVLALVAVYMIVDSMGLGPAIPFENSAILFAILIVGVVVYAVYCIRNDAYFGIGMNKKSYYILIIFVIVINGIAAVMNLMNEPFENGKLSLGPCMEILCVLAFAVILIALVIKNREDAKEAEAEDAEDGDLE
ncbi:MAG: hypothetical protein II696_00185 [Firmicutes bacterium]|nr:hypothetical protein [Bacillota bacterium]